MNYKIKILVMALTLTFATPAPPADGAIVIAIAKIIKAAVKKVIIAVDLMIQRLQNKTIWLQNAQKVLENKLNELKLTEIAEWTEKHRKLYKEYYEELWKVRNAIATIQRVKQIAERQVELVDEYTRTWELIKQDNHFTRSEIEYMYRVYTGILEESARNLDQILLVINSFKTQMTDAERLVIIDKCGNEIERNYYDLKRFNSENIQLSLSRAKNEQEIESVKKLYGLPSESQ
jgi:hypothetical protein